MSTLTSKTNKHRKGHGEKLCHLSWAAAAQMDANKINWEKIGITLAGGCFFALLGGWVGSLTSMIGQNLGAILGVTFYILIFVNSV